MGKPTILTGELEVDVITTADASIAVVQAEIHNETYEWSGTARRFHGDENEDGDRHDPEVGAKLALSRAFRSAASQLERQAMGKLRSNDHNRLASREAKAIRRANEGRHRIVRRKGRRAVSTTRRSTD